jgi:hypothetical protein
MSTQAQIEANRANAQLSTGPKTPEGKQIVAKNRITHGLTGQAVLIPGENPDDLKRLAIKLELELAPVNEVEAALVNTIANLQWRLDRVAAWIGQLTAECLEADPAQPSRLMKMFSKTANPCDAYERLNRHEASLRRQWHKCVRDLQNSKDERSKVLQGKNPAALNDMAETTARFKAFCARHEIPFPQIDNSNPIPPLPAAAATADSSTPPSEIDTHKNVVAFPSEV